MFVIMSSAVTTLARVHIAEERQAAIEPAFLAGLDWYRCSCHVFISLARSSDEHGRANHLVSPQRLRRSGQLGKCRSHQMRAASLVQPSHDAEPPTRRGTVPARPAGDCPDISRGTSPWLQCHGIGAGIIPARLGYLQVDNHAVQLGAPPVESPSAKIPVCGHCWRCWSIRRCSRTCSRGLRALLGR